MAFQTAPVQFQQGAGVVGELYDNGPVRSQPYTLNSALASYNVMGTAFTVLSQGFAQAGNPGGDNVFAGILANPKVAAGLGDTSSPLNPTITVPNQTLAEIVSMGSLWVLLPAPAAIGDLVIYDNTTGALATITPGTTLPGGKSFANAVVDRFTVTAAGLAVITITDTPIPPPTT